MIAGLLRRMSIRGKLVAMLMVTSTTVLLAASSAYVFRDYVRMRTEIARDVRAQARVVLDNTAAAISFRDPEAARETVATLAANPHIRQACLFDAAGRLFSQFRTSPDVQPCPSAPPPDGDVFSINRLELTDSAVQGGKRSGSLYLRSDLEELRARLLAQIVTAAVVLLFMVALAFALSSALQRVVSAPIAALADTAHAVSDRGDYSLRARKTTDDELGVLVDAFNGMLQRIETAERERRALLEREREANRLKDEFLMTLSHELRTPLNAILGWTRMLRSHVIAPEAAERALAKIERNAQAQARLVEDLLEVSRMTAGKVELHRQPMDLVRIVNDAIEAVRPDAEMRQVTIEKPPASSPLPTIGDPDRLQQVVWNLVSNAVKFSAAGSRVMVSVERHGHVDEIVVRDHGAGIDLDFLPHVFEAFRQADSSTTRAHGGLGLGLTIVRRITEMHRGEVLAFSEGPGHGAVFTIRLPVHVPEPAGLAADPPPGVRRPARGSLSGVVVLVVDDDRDTREMLESALSRAGARVHAAASAEEALALAASNIPTAIVSDIAMPGYDGYTMMERLRELLGPDMPRIAIALSAHAGDSALHRSLEAGFRRHLIKPLDPFGVIEVLQDLLDEPAV